MTSSPDRAIDPLLPALSSIRISHLKGSSRAGAGRYRTLFDLQAQRSNVPGEEGTTYDVLS